MKKKMVTIVTLVLVLMMTFMGCAAPAASDAAKTADESAVVSADADSSGAEVSIADKKVALVLWGTMYDFFVYIGAGAKKVAEEEGVQLDVLSTNDLAQGAELVSQAVTQKYDAIIVLGYEAYRTAYEEAIAANIPVITFDSFLEDVDLWGRVGSNNYQLGVTAGEYAVDYLTQKGDLAGQILIMNVPSTETMNLRSNGFMDTVGAAFPDLELTMVALNDNEANAEASQSKVDDLLIANPSGTVDMIFGSNAGMAIGSLSSVEVAGRNEVAVVGIDNEEGQLNALIDGTVYKASVGQDPVKIGEESMRAAIKALMGEKAGDTVVPGVLITSENVEEFLANQRETYAALEPYKP